MFLSSTAKMAHAVLPVAFFTEKTGTFTSAERLVQRIDPVLNARFEKTDLDVLVDLAALMGKPAMSYSGPEQVMKEIAGLVKVYEGVSYDRLNGVGLQWPCVDPEDPGKRTLYEGGFPGGKARLTPVAPIQKLDGDGLPMYLVPAVVKFHSGSLSTWSPALMDVCPDAYAEMSWKDIKALSVQEGDKVKITDASGASVQTLVKFSRRAMDGTVVVPFHFSGLKLNNLTRWDKPVIKVKVEKA